MSRIDRQPSAQSSSESSAASWREFLPLEDRALLAQCEVDRFRASGPGGQKRNVTDSAVRLRHRASGLTGEANESRSQHENRARALGRLRRELALRLRALPRSGEGLEALPLAFRGRNRLGARDPRFLVAVAEAFDLLEAAGWSLADAASAAGVTTAALGRFLAREPWLLHAANEQRRARELGALRR